MKLIYVFLAVLILFIVVEILIYVYNNIFIKVEDYYANETISKLNNLKQDLPTVKEEKFIPKKILQTYKDNNLPSFVKENLQKLNPYWEYHFYDDEKVKDFLKEEYPDYVLKKFNSFDRGAHKADLFRLCWLYKNGGVYIDIDVEFFDSLDNL